MRSIRGIVFRTAFAVFAASGLTPFAAQAATASRYPSWSGTEGDYTNSVMWYKGTVANAAGDCANLSRTAAGEATAYIREGMVITNGWINCGRTNDFNIVMSGGYVQLMQDENVNDAALKLARGEGTTIRPTGSLTISGGFVNVTNGCVSVGERGNGILTMTGGELWAYGRLSIARLDGSSGTMTVSGGAKVTAYSYNLLRPSATLVVDGGTLARTRFIDDYAASGYQFIWGDTGATVQIGANGATFVLSRDATVTIPISSVPGTAGVLEKRGAGALRFTATATNTYAGATVVEEGALMAEAPYNLPGYDEPGRVTVRSGAKLFFGKGWTDAEMAVAMANVTMESGASFGTEFDISDEDVTISDDLSYPGGIAKYGAKMLTLTGHNVFGGEQKICEGTLRADFGTGLDANYCVTLAGGSLSSLSGDITTTIGSGAGQVNTVADATPAFSARGVPLAVDLLNGAGAPSGDTYLCATNAFPSRSLILNDANADQPITFANNIDIRGVTKENPFSLYVNSGTATMASSLLDGTYNQTTFKKYGSGTLRITGSAVRDVCYRFQVEAGDVVLDHPASLTSSSTGSSLFFFMNKYGSGTLSATNQTITTDSNFNHYDGHSYFKGGKLTVKGNIIPKNGDVVFDGGTVDVSTSVIAGDNVNMSGVGIFTNGVKVTVGSDFTAGLDYNNVFGRLEVYDNCCVTAKVIGAGSGTIAQYGGAVYGSGSSLSARIGRYTGRSGFYYMMNGELGCASTINLGRSPRAYGLIWQTGGTICPSSSIVIGDVSSSTGVVHILGGEMRHASDRICAGKDGVGELVVRGEGVVKTISPLSLANASSTGSGRVMLCKGGVIEAPQVLGHGKTAGGRYAEFVFDGGTLRASADSATYVSNLTAFAVGTGGGAVDTDGHDVAFAQPLTATALCSDLAHRWSFNGDFVDSVTGESPVDTNGWAFITQGNGQAVKLTGGTKGTSHISLGPNKLPVDGSEATIEFWARPDKHNSWQRAFDIGLNSTNYFTLTWRRNGSSTDRCTIKYNGVQTMVDDALQPYTTEANPAWNHMCVTCKQDGDGKWTIRAYRKNLRTNNEYRGEFAAPAGWSLANQDQTYTYIGRALENYNDASASYDEFRIWKRALTDAEIAANEAAGPDALPATTFEKRGAGRLTLVGANTYAQPTVVSGGTLALAAGASLPPATAITVADGATLDLGCNAAAAESLAGAGTLANGTLALSGTADISSMSFAFAGNGLPASADPVVVLEAAGGLTGHFASASLPNGFRLSYAGNKVALVKTGACIILR